VTLIYWLAAIAGWPFLVLFVFFGGDADADVGFDMDVDADIDLDAGGSDVPGGGPFAAIFSFFSLRSIVFFLAMFGLTGLILEWVGAGALVTLLAAIALGVFSMWLNTTLVRYLIRSSSDSQVADREIAGSAATVVMPISADRKGRIAVEIAEQTIYMVASVFRPKAGDEFEKGDRVVIVEVVNGGALVAPLKILD